MYNTYNLDNIHKCFPNHFKVGSDTMVLKLLMPTIYILLPNNLTQTIILPILTIFTFPPIVFHFPSFRTVLYFF